MYAVRGPVWRIVGRIENDYIWINTSGALCACQVSKVRPCRAFLFVGSVRLRADGAATHQGELHESINYNGLAQ